MDTSHPDYAAKVEALKSICNKFRKGVITYEEAIANADLLGFDSNEFDNTLEFMFRKK